MMLDTKHSIPTETFYCVEIVWMALSMSKMVGIQLGIKLFFTILVGRLIACIRAGGHFALWPIMEI